MSKLEAIWGGGGRDETDQRICIQSNRYSKTRACIVVQRMAHHNHLVHLNYLDLSFLNLW